MILLLPMKPVNILQPRFSAWTSVDLHVGQINSPSVSLALSVAGDAGVVLGQVQARFVLLCFASRLCYAVWLEDDLRRCR
jgi:hypothetical protein